VGLPWSPRQLAMLQAMDLSPMRLRAADTAPVRLEAPVCEAIDFEHPLFAAVWRASGLDLARPSEFDWAAWAQAVQLPSLDALACDPQAKRRLWRRLRARRGHPA
jgi:hypothetical protein